MQGRTTGLNLCAILAALSGALTIGLMAGSIHGIEDENTLGVCCLYLVIAVLFFALAGGFKSNGQWNVQMMTFMGFVIIAIVLFAAIMGIIALYGAIALIILAILVVAGILLSLKSEILFGTA